MLHAVPSLAGALARATLARPALVAAIAMGLAAGRAAGQADWIVDASGGGDFTTIQAAVDAAVSGQQILVRPGFLYPPFAIDGKALVVRAESAGSVRVPRGASVGGVPAGAQVELFGLLLNDLGREDVLGLACSSSPGTVRLVECTLGGHDGGQQARWEAGPALFASGCAELVLVRCTVLGGDGATNEDEDLEPPASDGASALLASDCGLSIHDSTLRGGAGGGEHDTTCHSGGRGGAGAVLDSSSTLFAAGSSFLGGAGGDGGDGESFGCDCADGGRGGDGLDASGASVRWYASSASGGAGGPPGGVTCSSGQGGSAIVGAAPLAEDRAPFGFGTSGACPCANLGRALAGCENSFATGGARLELVGAARVSADTLRLEASGLPTTTPPALFFQGTLRQARGVGSVLADGLLCAGGAVVRLKARPAQGGLVSFGFGVPGDPPVSVRGSVPPAGATRTYQVWYRNNQGFCTSERFNLSNGVELVWAP